MLKDFFCLDCENEFTGEVDEKCCPDCGSENIMDMGVDNGYYEGDMGYDEHDGVRE